MCLYCVEINGEKNEEEKENTINNDESFWF